MSSIIVLGLGAGMVDLLRAAAPEHDFIHDIPQGEIGIIHGFRFIESPLEPAAYVPEKRTAGYKAPGRARHKKGKR